MTDACTADPSAAQPTEPELLLDALQLWNARRFDPVRFQFIEALARRAANRRGAARDLLRGRLAAALQDFAQRFDTARERAQDVLAAGTRRFPDAAEALQSLFDAGDFAGLGRRLAQLEAGRPERPLAELLDRLRDEHAADTAEPQHQALTNRNGRPTELKSVRYFRRTWSRLKLDHQLSQAFIQAPQNAGPLNSHFLVVQALKRMRELSPEYLEQFLSYADALLWLEQQSGTRPIPANTAGSERRRKRK